MKTKRLLFLVFFGFFILRASTAFAWEVWTTTPWLALVTRFIGGVFVTVRPIEFWSEDGQVVRKVQNRAIPKDGRIIALDTEEASRLGLNQKEWTALAPLYRTAPFDKKRLDYFFADPSSLPFIAQKVFTVLSQFDPPNYPYYQRRLSEFQTRLDSTVIVGRRLLSGSTFIYIGGNFSGMLTAAGCLLESIDESLKTLWEQEKELDRLSGLLGDALDRRIPVIVDTSSKKLKEALRNNKEVLFLEKPVLDQDILLFFHDQYILLWNRLAALKQLRTPRK